MAAPATRDRESLEQAVGACGSGRTRRGRLQLDTSFELPEGCKAGSSIGEWTSSAWSARVPIVPPKHRPRANADLGRLVVLWEVDDWTWQTVPRPPGDPALLQHVGGDVYASSPPGT